MTLPTLHLNGTSPERLRDAYVAAHEAIMSARSKLRETAPNARDYYPVGAVAMAAAEREHRSRQERLESVLDELEALIRHCDRGK